jgi:putative transposase
VSQVGERLWEVYQAFAQRDLSDYEVSYLFIDGIAERLRPGVKRAPVHFRRHVEPNRPR